MAAGQQCYPGVLHVCRRTFSKMESHISVFAFNLQGSAYFELLYNILECD